MKRISSLILVLFITISLLGCNGQTSDQKEVSYQRLFTNVIIDRNLLLSTKQTNVYKSDSIDLYLINKTDKSIHFSNDMGVRIFAYLEYEGQWKEIKNLVIYSGNDLILQTGSNNPFSVTSSVIYPDLSSVSSPGIIRVIVIGTLYINNEITDDKIGNYIDIYLK